MVRFALCLSSSLLLVGCGDDLPMGEGEAGAAGSAAASSGGTGGAAASSGGGGLSGSAGSGGSSGSGAIAGSGGISGGGGASGSGGSSGSGGTSGSSGQLSRIEIELRDMRAQQGLIAVEIGMYDVWFVWDPEAGVTSKETFSDAAASCVARVYQSFAPTPVGVDYGNVVSVTFGTQTVDATYSSAVHAYTASTSASLTAGSPVKVSIQPPGSAQKIEKILAVPAPNAWVSPPMQQIGGTGGPWIVQYTPNQPFTVSWQSTTLGGNIDLWTMRYPPSAGVPFNSIHCDVPSAQGQVTIPWSMLDKYVILKATDGSEINGVGFNHVVSSSTEQIGDLTLKLTTSILAGGAEVVQ